MPLLNEVILGLIVTCFASFGVLLATLSWLDRRYERAKPRAGVRPAGDHAHHIQPHSA